MANENAVTNIADLWVAAAMNVDNEDPFESDNEDVIEDDADADSLDLGEPLSRSQPDAELPNTGRRNSFAVPNFGVRTPGPSSAGSSAPQQLSNRHPSISFSPLTSPPPRRLSAVPSIFAHPGVKTPSAVLDAQQLLLANEGDSAVPADSLTPITESRHSQADVESLAEKPPSLASQLPIVVIIQYGVMALHCTTHDQIFMSYLVSDYKTGGLGLNAGHFAQLIALMCLAQIAYQFYLYPNIGPPRGKFSHLSMFRLGNVLFIPSYLTVVLYRPLASSGDDGNLLLMSALALSTALRYCGITFGYTAIAILLNYMTPPNAVGYANGIAQSIVSLARCVGPVIGGYLWSASVQDHPSGYYLGFVVCAGVCALSVLQSFFIR